MINSRLFNSLCTVFLVCILFNGYGFVSPPNLSSPTSGVTLKFFEASLSVSSVSTATGYQFQYDTSANFNSSQLRKDTSSKTFIYTQTLRKGMKYYWRARAYKPGDTSDWSNTNNFTIFTTYELNQPFNNTTGPLRSLNGLSSASFRPATYIFEADTSAGFASPLHVTRLLSSPQFIDTPLFQFGHTIYWKARAVSELGDTVAWSSTFKYTIYKQPTINTTSSSVHPQTILTWSSTFLAQVVFQLDTNSSFSSPLLVEKTLNPATLRDTLRDLRFGYKYYFRIRGKFDTCFSSWSTTISFTVYASEIITNPSFHSTLNTLFVNFSWRQLTGTSPQFQFAKDSAYTQLIKDTVITGTSTSYPYPIALDMNTRYYVRIRYMHAKDTSIWTYNYFTTYNGAVDLSSPNNNLKSAEVRPRFLFRPQTWATSYVMEIDTGKVFGSTPSSYYIRIVSFTPQSIFVYADTTLRYNQDYVWRVYAIKGNDTAAPSIAYTLKTAASPLLYFPQNNYVGIGTATNGLITGIKGSSFVQWELDTSMLFNSPEYATGTDIHKPDDFDPNHIALNFPGDRLFKKTYYWRARCLNAVDTSKWTAPFFFSTTTDPYIIAPIDGAVNVALNATLIWSIQGSASDYRYQYQFATDSNFATKPIITLPANESAQAAVTGNLGTQYYWRARATHPRDTSGWTPITRYKTIDVPVISPPNLLSPPANTTNLPIEPVMLTWSFTSFATTYDVQVARDINFTNIAASANTAGTGAQFSGMQPRSRYYWRVRGRMDAVVSTWSTTQWFQSGDPTGLSEATTNLQVLLYPNPATTEVTLSAPETFAVSVFDAKGSCIYQQENANTTHILQTGDWAKGLYLVKITAEDGVMMQRFIVE